MAGLRELESGEPVYGYSERAGVVASWYMAGLSELGSWEMVYDWSERTGG